MTVRASALLASSLLMLGSGCQTTPSAAKPSYFAEHVKPILEAQCLRCHQGPNAPAGLNLSNRDNALAAQNRRHHRFIVPGQPDQSLLLQAIARNGTHPKLMPRLTLSLTDDQIGVLREWIEDGATWPQGAEGQLHAVPNPENP